MDPGKRYAFLVRPCPGWGIPVVAGCAALSEEERWMKHVVQERRKVNTWHVGNNAGFGVAFRTALPRGNDIIPRVGSQAGVGPTGHDGDSSTYHSLLLYSGIAAGNVCILTSD